MEAGPASAGPLSGGITRSGTLTTVDSKEKKIGHRRVDEQTGQVTYKKVS